MDPIRDFNQSLEFKYKKYFDPQIDENIDLKGKLKSQLDELQEEVRSMCSEGNDSPRSLPSSFASPIPKHFSPKKVPSKADDILTLKKEVSSWSSCIKDMQKSIGSLKDQVLELEKQITNSDCVNELISFKEEIIQEIRQIEFAESSFKQTGNCEDEFEGLFREFMNNWEKEVFKPQISAIYQRLEKRRSVEKEDPQEIMKKIKEKLALKANLEKKKREVSDNQFFEFEEERFRIKNSPKNYY